ncbi:MAG: alpha-L-fucosidase [Bryobacteraceae bacterium]|jgi:alpha-L-fucosidase
MGFLGAAGVASRHSEAQAIIDVEIAKGPFQAAGDSLSAYTSPQWFHDAKFGIWSHWGPSSAIGAGDWYARNMYIEGSRQYQYHLKTYGHPSQFGYKDTIPLWKAELFAPKFLARLYREAGAKYFVSMGVHCDNFDLWNSRNHRWNSTRMGPKRDIVGEWREAARTEGLRFGVSEHVWGSYNWWETNKGADKQGRYAGVPYDGNDSANWDLYFPPHVPAREAWAEQGNEPEEWKREWFLRARDLIDQHQPDLYYEDGGIPFGRWGRSLVAHYYNQSLRGHPGQVEVVYTGKRRSECASGLCVLDVERGVVDEIELEPFQTDTCIGDWHYNRDAVYKRPKTIIDLLVDIVSRNGNLLLNIPLPASGMPDEAELKILAAITAWMKVNSEAIYATRPWKIFGEGPGIRKTPPGSGFAGTVEHFNESKRVDLTGEDIRFTTKDDRLYGFAMGWNPRETHIKALAQSRRLEQRKIARVELLDSHNPLKWKLADDGLHIESPQQWPSEHAVAFRIFFG